MLITSVPSARWHPTPQEKTRIANNWHVFLTRRPTNENASLCRLIQATRSTIEVATDVTYRDVVGLRLTAPESFPFLVVTALAHISTADGERIFLERDSGDWPHSLECPGGFIRAAKLPITAESFIEKRVMRDLALDSDSFSNITFHGGFTNQPILEYVLVYSLTLTETATTLIKHHPLVHALPSEYHYQQHNSYCTLPLHQPTFDSFAFIERVSGKTPTLDRVLS